MKTIAPTENATEHREQMKDLQEEMHAKIKAAREKIGRAHV